MSVQTLTFRVLLVTILPQIKQLFNAHSASTFNSYSRNVKSARYCSSGLRFRKQLDNSAVYAANLFRVLSKWSFLAVTTSIVFATRTSYSYTNGNVESAENALFALKRKNVYSDSACSSFTTDQ